MEHQAEGLLVASLALEALLQMEVVIVIEHEVKWEYAMDLRIAPGGGLGTPGGRTPGGIPGIAVLKQNL